MQHFTILTLVPAHSNSPKPHGIRHGPPTTTTTTTPALRLYHLPPYNAADSTTPTLAPIRATTHLLSSHGLHNTQGVLLGLGVRVVEEPHDSCRHGVPPVAGAQPLAGHRGGGWCDESNEGGWILFRSVRHRISESVSPFILDEPHQ